MTEPLHAEIAIVGGGPVGGATALALAGAGFSPRVLESRPNPGASRDPRAIALSAGSRLILERIGAWRDLPATPIATIHVSQQGHFGSARMTARETGVPALGYVVTYGDLDAAVHRAIRRAGVALSPGTEVQGVESTGAYAAVHCLRDGKETALTAQLAVVADGGRSLGRDFAARSRDYGRVAVVCRVRTERFHDGEAFERFTREGPAALLPVGDELALVWTADPVRGDALLALPEAEFLSALDAHFGRRLGRFVAATPRAVFPLLMRVARDITRPRIALVGNAAQTLHPVAGQGFNLGLRDAWALAEAAAAAGREGIGTAGMLADYAARRRVDAGATLLATDFLARAFASPLAPVRHVLGAGVAALDLLPGAKRFFARHMMFGTRA